MTEREHDPAGGVFTAAFLLTVTGFMIGLAWGGSTWWLLPAFLTGVVGGYGLGDSVRGLTDG